MDLLAAARAGDGAAFESLVVGHRRELLAHCYPMLGSLQDAEDAVQETMGAAWRGLAGFEGRSSLRAWLYRAAANCCLRLASKRPTRPLSWDCSRSRDPDDDLGIPDMEGNHLDPWPEFATSSTHPDAPDTRFEARESVELAYIAALQHVPAKHRRSYEGFSSYWPGIAGHPLVERSASALPLVPEAGPLEHRRGPCRRRSPSRSGRRVQ